MTREGLKIQLAANYADTKPSYVDGNYVRGLEAGYKKGWDDADEHPKNPWHKTDEDFPKEGVDYQMKDGEFLCGRPMLLHVCEDDDDSGDDYKGYFDGKFWRYWDKPISSDVVMGKVTHWMPIPETPKGGKE